MDTFGRGDLFFLRKLTQTGLGLNPTFGLRSYMGVFSSLPVSMACAPAACAKVILHTFSAVVMPWRRQSQRTPVKPVSRRLQGGALLHTLLIPT